MGRGLFKQRVRLFQGFPAPVSSVNQLYEEAGMLPLLISPPPSLLKYKGDCPKMPPPSTFAFREFTLVGNLRTFQAASATVIVL